jgi:hypothetical protein
MGDDMSKGTVTQPEIQTVTATPVDGAQPAGEGSKVWIWVGIAVLVVAIAAAAYFML